MSTVALFNAIAGAFRSVRCLGRVTSDAADLALLRRRAADTLPTMESDTWRSAFGLCMLSSVLALRADGAPAYVSLPLAVIMMAFAWSWAARSTADARKVYVVTSVGAFIQFLMLLAPRFEPLFAAWFALAAGLAGWRLAK